MSYKSFFWLHIKKSAGITTRELLQPYYKEVDRTKKPMTFIQADPLEYNDILNNYRVVLGDFQFKRALFAKRYLYPDSWESICSFAFSREPLDRCVSMFYYLYHKKKSFARTLYVAFNNLKSRGKVGLSASYDFDLFLELIEIAHFNSQSNYQPSGLHFSTHTAPMFSDVADEDGNPLLTKIYRLEDLHKGIEQIFDLCGLDYKSNNTVKNKNSNRGGFKPSELQRRKVEKLYSKDFEIYEKAAFMNSK